MPDNPQMPNRTTGLAQLPDVGTLSYNGVTFSALYKSNLTGTPIYDAAGRTVKCVEWTLTVEGTVTLGRDQVTTDAQWTIMRKQLDQCSGMLIYEGKGFGVLTVNVPGGNIQGSVQDIEWGPKPKTLYFQPLGASRSALITWQVTTRISENGYVTPLVQFNEDVAVTYDEDGYTQAVMRGTMEIPLSRRLGQRDRNCPVTVDDFRRRFLDIVRRNELLRFRVTRRVFNTSRDKRTMEWEIVMEEQGPMGLPAGITNARGTMSVKSMDVGPGMVRWLCSLKGTYTVRKDFPRRTAWWAFVSLLKFRMSFANARNVIIPKIADPAKDEQQPKKPPLSPIIPISAGAFGIGATLFGKAAGEIYKKSLNKKQDNPPKAPQEFAIVQSFSFDEGLYLDSKTITFECSWLLITMLEGLLVSTGVWQKSDTEDSSNWSVAMADIQGWKSWLANRIDAKSDVIVDLGGGDPNRPGQVPQG